jgi:hypothetical protein
MNFNLKEMIESQMSSNKHILMTPMIQSIIKDNNEIFRMGEITTNNIIVKNTPTSKKIITDLYEQRLQYINLSIDETFNKLLTHHFNDEFIENNIQIINNPHLLNSLSDSSLNGWRSGDFILHVKKYDEVKNTFCMFSSIVNSQNILLENKLNSKVLPFTQNTSLHFDKYLNFVEKNKIQSLQNNEKKGNWFSLEKNVIAILYLNDEYWTFIKIN